MNLVGLLIAVIVFGLILYVIQLLPLAPPFKTIAYIICILILLFWLLGSFGVVNLGGGPRLR